MTDDVKARRRHRAPERADQAAATRRAVLAAARDLFTSRGYTATTVGRIAQRAGVNVDTLYAAVGRTPALLREVVETAISGQDHAVPAEQRDYVRAVRTAPTAAEKSAFTRRRSPRWRRAPHRSSWPYVTPPPATRSSQVPTVDELGCREATATVAGMPSSGVPDRCRQRRARRG
jgi:AcrR family transcriptional regulator